MPRRYAGPLRIGERCAKVLEPPAKRQRREDEVRAAMSETGWAALGLVLSKAYTDIPPLAKSLNMFTINTDLINNELKAREDAKASEKQRLECVQMINSYYAPRSRNLFHVRRIMRALFYLRANPIPREDLREAVMKMYRLGERLLLPRTQLEQLPVTSEGDAGFTALVINTLQHLAYHVTMVPSGVVSREQLLDHFFRYGTSLCPTCEMHHY